MKRRLGIMLLVMLTVLLLKLVSMGLGWINLESDAAVFCGISLIGTVVVLSPVAYAKVWKSMINPTILKENTHEV